MYLSHPFAFNLAKAFLFKEFLFFIQSDKILPIIDMFRLFALKLITGMPGVTLATLLFAISCILCFFLFFCYNLTKSIPNADFLSFCLFLFQHLT